MSGLLFRTLDRDEIEQIWTIDRREFIAQIYRLQDGVLHLEPLNVTVPGWNPDNVQNTTPLLYDTFDRGGHFYGVFDSERLVGESVLDTIWRGPRKDLLQLEMLHVSRDYRKTGLGTLLFEHARTEARDRGARGLYISASPAENTIRFYQRRGSVLLATPDPELFAREPEDIHLECPITAEVRPPQAAG